MSSNVRLAEIATLVGDPARVSMLQALMDGRALTATELSRAASLTPQTAGGHLRRLVETGLLEVNKQGGDRYHRLASPTIAQLLESMMQVAADLRPAAKSVVVGPRDAALREGIWPRRISFSLVDKIRRWHQIRVTYRKLSNLDDRSLKDIGLYRSEIGLASLSSE